ncbi:MAG: tetratricopeptide repeat domain protein [Candidatus Saccharibacteria bacterium]|nr:tetratricopeptide repeat domain protein [Candidatus Saccharibacteria bacterium]
MLTPGLVEKKEATAIAGSNKPVYSRKPDPIQQFKASERAAPGSFMAQILAKERELAKLRIRRSGENPRSVIEIGDIHFLKKKFTKARDAYLNAIKLDKNNSAVYRKLINCYIALNNVDLACECYENLIAINPLPEFKHEYVLLRLATANGDKDKLKAVETDLKNLVQENNTNSHVLNTYAMYLGHVSEKPEQSKKYLDKAINLDPSNFHAINNLGVYYVQTNQLDKAREQFDNSLELNPQYDAGYENIAGVYIAQEDYKNALAVLEKAAALGVRLSDKWVHKVGWILIQLGEFKRAVVWHKQKLREEPENDYLLNNLGFCYQMLDNIEKAQEYFSKAIECFEAKLNRPGFIPDIRSKLEYQNLMALAQDLGNADLLDDTAKKLLALEPSSPMGFFFRGQAQRMKKNYTFAKKCYEASIKGEPGVPDPYVCLAFIYEAIDSNYTKAIDILENAPFKSDVAPLFTNNLAYAYIKNGDLKKAESLLAKVKLISHPSLFATRGLLELYKDDFKKAESYYSKAIKNLHADDKQFAEQVWEYEQALYWKNNNDILRSQKSIENALKLGDVSYAYDLTKALEVAVKSH